MTSQFEGAERIADKWGITRDDTDAFGLAVPAAGRAGVGRGPLRHARSSPSTRPTSTRRASPPARTHTVSRDEGLRETTLEKLATLKPVARENGVHTAGIVVADLRRRRRRAADDRARRPPRSACSPGPASSTPASSASTRCSCSPARSTPPSRLLERTGLTHRRHRRLRDQRGVRLGRAGLGRGARAPTWTRSTRTAAPSPSATRSAAPAPSCSPRRCTSSSAPTAATAWSRCAAAAGSAPAPSSSASEGRGAGTVPAGASASHPLGRVVPPVPPARGGRRLSPAPEPGGTRDPAPARGPAPRPVPPRPLFAGLAIGALAGCSPGTRPRSAGPPAPAVMVRDVDGDTIVARVGGHLERVRLLGIDTPETKDPTQAGAVLRPRGLVAHRVAPATRHRAAGRARRRGHATATAACCSTSGGRATTCSSTASSRPTATPRCSPIGPTPPTSRELSAGGRHGPAGPAGACGAAAADRAGRSDRRADVGPRGRRPVAGR